MQLAQHAMKYINVNTDAENEGATRLVYLCQFAIAIACTGITLHMASGDTTKNGLISNFKWEWLYSTGLIDLQS